MRETNIVCPVIRWKDSGFPADGFLGARRGLLLGLKLLFGSRLGLWFWVLFGLLLGFLVGHCRCGRGGHVVYAASPREIEGAPPVV